ncbi:translation initiation factor IF-5A [Candidatus Woesearchaeota archaeon CG_4_10_14_0_2_um_filter_33_10]|nr:MAG: translation initiation factor IF-5A [Candidatus Woesearchaeota archaeon CG1_02_33_12]PIN79234.1 MAG: translation initiation factor IF-5A [Candidatus Woesearchaeota archaeon CG10_big_fil_rev_8_21_14_0_10_33_12]PIU72534.1 MAG: translation initiation factor IF-5A [Candidatus Woesearchaeota archaeon CG06_land_8_20_14_3_00_33_13]PIZ53988.1 MAG: translation initiation factor IF-5A [Candidatus Woesearchaeota archaeon CG_4_10_14_0_2_um_filter_33_10]
MATKLIAATSIQEGRYIVLDDVPCKVTSVQISRPGKHGHAKVRITAIGIIDNKKRDIVMPGHDMVPTPVIDKKTAQVLSVHDNIANVMDAETYETFDIEVPEELKADCIPGSNVLYWSIIGSKIMKQIKSE